MIWDQYIPESLKWTSGIFEEGNVDNRKIFHFQLTEVKHLYFIFIANERDTHRPQQFACLSASVFVKAAASNTDKLWRVERHTLEHDRNLFRKFFPSLGDEFECLKQHDSTSSSSTKESVFPELMSKMLISS